MAQLADELGRERPLVVLLEDDTAQREVLLDLFAGEQIEVAVCATLDEVRALVERRPRAVVVADSWSSGVWGDLEDRPWREIDELAHVAPVVLTSGQEEWGRRGASLTPGGAVVLPKPYDLDDLVEVVRLAEHGPAAAS